MSKIHHSATKAFDKFASGFDTLGDKWQDMGANEYFIAGYKAALEQREPAYWEVKQGEHVFVLSAEEFITRSFDTGSFRPLYIGE